MNGRLRKATVLRLYKALLCSRALAVDTQLRPDHLLKPAQPLSSLQSLARGYSTAAKPSGGGRKGGPVSYLSLALTVATGGGLVLWFQQLQKQKLKEASLKAETYGTAAIGGPFELIDQNGKPFTERDMLGHFALLYFGFTFCPDICPDELEKMAAAVDKIEEETGKQVQPVFISVDPERDGVEQVRSYVREFHPRLVGLTGPPDKVEHAARQYRVYHMKTGEARDYLVDHSIIIYLVDPEGRFVTFYGKNFTTEQLAKSVAGHVRSWYA